MGRLWKKLYKVCLLFVEFPFICYDSFGKDIFNLKGSGNSLEISVLVNLLFLFSWQNVGVCIILRFLGTWFQRIEMSHSLMWYTV